MKFGQSSGINQKSDHDEVLKLIKISKYNAADQLLHTPSKVFVLFIDEFGSSQRGFVEGFAASLCGS